MNAEELQQVKETVYKPGRFIQMVSEGNVGMSGNMRRAMNKHARPVKKDDKVERYTGVMIFGHKTGAEVEIKQGDKLIKEATGYLTRR